MKDDIKEILAYFEEYIKITDMHDSEPMLNWKDLKIVLDYITNLQEEIDRLNKECDTYMKIATKKQQRIDKAIEYIKEDLRECKYENRINRNELLNILGDKND